MKHNEHYREDMKKLAAELQADNYYEKSLIIYDIFNNQQKASIFLPENKNFCRYKKIDESYYLKGEFKNHCDMIEDIKMITINSDGNVVPCCKDYFSKHIFGNVFEQSVSKVWNSKKFRDFRKKSKIDKVRLIFVKIVLML
jgi:MoaA/NifB/PqqE/SkfB family radical SAM enzyme